jgi:hypothetical protein
MRNTLRGLTIEITKTQIKVTDKTSSKTYNRSFILTETNHIEMLRDAKSWLWNMGSYNGQANEMMEKHNIDWVRELSK